MAGGVDVLLLLQHPLRRRGRGGHGEGGDVRLQLRDGPGLGACRGVEGVVVRFAQRAGVLFVVEEVMGPRREFAGALVEEAAVVAERLI